MLRRTRPTCIASPNAVAPASARRLGRGLLFVRRFDSAALGPYYPRMLGRAASFGFIRPCLPLPAERPPSGNRWIHEVKHDGYRLMVRRDFAGVRLLTRNGHDWSERFPLILISAAALRVRSCLIDGEAVCCDEHGVAVFQRLRLQDDTATFLYAFDLLRLDGVDLRREPIEVRKEALADLPRGSEAGLQLNDHFREAGDVIFRHACKLGCEGIVSKRLGSRYRSGRSSDWLKFKNPDCSEAVDRGGLEQGAKTVNKRDPFSAIKPCRSHRRELFQH
jgi:bifunctional non-homologous end joining protein LigD